MRRFAIVLAVLTTMIAAPASAFFSLSGFKNSMIEFLISKLSTEGEFEISVSEVTDNEEGATELRELKISDSKGVWFTAQKLDFAWNPSRLLRGEVEFSRLTMLGVEVLRAPVSPESAPKAEAPADPDAPLIPEIAWPRSPLTLRVDGFALTDVQIAEGVLGHALAFNATGAARDEGDIQSVNLNLVRTDAVTGRIALAYARDFSDDTLKVDLTAEEAAGGLIAALSGLPGDAPSTLSLKADGPPENWRLALDLDLAETLGLSGNAGISYRGPLKVDAKFTALPGEQLSPQIAALLGTEAELVARAAEGEDGTIEIKDGRLTSPDLSLSAAGQYNRLTSEADLRLDLDAGARLADPVDGVDFGGLTFGGRLQGAPGSFAADGDLVLLGLATQPVDIALATLNVDLRQSGPADQTTTTLEIAGLTEGLRLDRIEAEVIGEADTQIAAELTGNALTLETFSLDSKVLKLALSGKVDIETTDAEFGFGLAAPQLAPVAAAYGVDVRGTIDISGDVTRADEQTRLTFDTALSSFAHPMADASALNVTGSVQQDAAGLEFDVAGTALRLRLDRIGPQLLPEATFNLAGALVDEVLTLEAVTLGSPLLTAQAAGTVGIAGGAGDIRYKVETPDLGPVARLYDQPAGGALSAGGTTILGGTTGPQITGDLAVAGLVWDGTPYGRVVLAHDVFVGDAPEGRITVNAEGSAYGPARLATRFALAQPTLRLTELEADGLGVSARGDLTANIEAPLVTGEITFSAPDLGSLGRVTGAALGGSARGALRLTDADARQGANLELTASKLSTDGARIGTARLAAKGADLTGTPRIEVTAKAGGIEAADIVIETLTARANGPLARLNFAAEARGTRDTTPLEASMAGIANAGGPTTRATIARMETRLGDDKVSLNQPLQIAARAGTVAVRGLDLALPDGGRVNGEVTLHGGPLSGQLEIDAPELGFLKRLAAVPVSEGSLAGQVDFDTRRRRANANFSARNLIFDGIEAANGLDIESQIDWQGRAADVSATVTGPFGNPLQVTARVPLDGAQPFPGLAKRGPVEAKIDWQGEIGDLWAMVPVPGHVVTGKTTIDLGVVGDIANPAITGGVSIDAGSYQNLDAGTILTDLSVHTTLLPSGTMELEITASDGGTGTVRTAGSIALDASGIDLVTTIDRAVLVRRDDVLARIDSKIAVKGPVSALSVDGTITIDEAEIRLVNNNPPGIVTLDDVLIKGEPEPEETEKTSGVTLNLDVNSPGRMFVRGRGLDSEWKMALAIRGDAASPRITGRIEKVRGRLDLIGKAFDLSRGRIDFLGGKRIDPLIDVVLERETSDLTGRIEVDGPASDPQLGFSSTPALPEDEVLPRTLFGKSSQALTGTQAIQLGLGLATLMDGGGGTLDQVRGAIGLDSLQVEQDEEGNTAVAIGKEVAEGIWVGSKQVLGAARNSVEVEIELIEDVIINTDIDPAGGASVGVKWKKDF